MSNGFRAPNGNRFVDFQEFRDGKGFSIDDGSEFYYDKMKGWFDEKGNYFDKNGNPSTANKESQDFWNSIKDQYEIFQDDLLDEYERGMDYGGGSDEEDDLDDDYHGQHHQNRHDNRHQRQGDNGYGGNQRNSRPEVTLSRNQNVAPPQEQKTVPSTTQSKPQFIKTVPITTPKPIVKTQEVVKSEPTPQQKPIVKTQQVVPALTGDEVILVITGCLSTEPELAFFDWLDKKIHPVRLLSQRSLEKDGKRAYKIVLRNLGDAEQALNNLKADDKGKVPYKGKFALICKLDKK